MDELTLTVTYRIADVVSTLELRMGQPSGLPLDDVHRVLAGLDEVKLRLAAEYLPSVVPGDGDCF